MSRNSREIRIVLVYTPRLFLAAFSAIAFLGWPTDLASESLTLSTTYPSPAGVYNSLITTGGSIANNNTTLNQNGGDTLLVPNATNAPGWTGIGAASPTTDPRGAKLVMGGNVDMTNSEIVNLQLTPINPADAASKAYVDAKAAGGPGSWTCVARSNNGLTNGVIIISASCQPGEQVIAGGCSGPPGVAGNYFTNGPTLGAPGWQCGNSVNAVTITAIANCCH